MALREQKAIAWWSVFVLFAINILNFYDRHVPGALVEPLRQEFHLTDTQNGLLSSAFVWIYALVGLPIGRLADRASRKKLLGAGVFVWASLTAFGGMATSYVMLLISRLGVGVGEATCAPVGTSWLGDLFPPEKRARALAFFMLAVPIGGSFGFIFTGPFAQAYGWRAALMVAAAPAVILLPLLLRLPEPQRGAADMESPFAGKGEVAAPAKGAIRSVLRIPTMWWIIASGATFNFNMYVMAVFLPAFFSRVHGLSLASSNLATGLIYLLGGLCGGVLGGWLGDAVLRRWKNGRMLVPAGIAVFAVPVLFFAFAAPAGSFALAFALLTLAYAALNTYYGGVYSAIQDVVAHNLRGTAMAVYFLGMYAAGGSYGPIVAGKLSDILAHRIAAQSGAAVLTETHLALGLQQALFLVPAGCILLGFVLYMGSRTIVKDMARCKGEA